MTKIKNTVAYPFDKDIDENDFLLGSDANTPGKTTKSYRMRDLSKFFSSMIGQSGLGYVFSIYADENNMVPPAGYFFSENNSTTMVEPNEVTYLRFNKLNVNGIDCSKFFEFLVAEESFDIKISSVSDPNKFFFFEYGEIEVFEDYFRIPVTLSSSPEESSLVLDKTYSLDVVSKGGSGGIASVVAGENISVDNSDPSNPIVSVPNLGTSAFTDSDEYATAEQGALADSSIQPNSNISLLNNDSNFLSNSEIQILLQAYILLNEKGVINGVATLDANGKVPLTQINDALLGNVNYQGIYNASTNSPDLTTVRPKGQYFIVGVEGTRFGISFEVGDWIISNGTSYNKVDNTDAVSSVAGLVGVITKEALAAVLENVTNIAIQDMNGTEQFRVTDAIRFEGASFNPTDKKVIINPLMPQTVFLSSTGNDTTALPQDRTRPFQTLNAVVTWMLSQTHRGFNWTIETLDSGLFTYTLNMAGAGGLGTYLRGFNITNSTNATISIENNYECREQEIFNFSLGKLQYNLTATTVLITNNTFTNYVRNVFKHDINIVEFKNSANSSTIVDRGIHRFFAANVPTNYLNWGTLIIGNGTFNFSDNYPSNLSIKIGVVNNNETLSKGRGTPVDMFFCYGTYPNMTSIGTYNNLTSTQQSLSSNFLEIDAINSANALTEIGYSNFSLSKNALFQNVTFKQSGQYVARPIINGNGNTLTINSTISSYFYKFAANSNNFKTSNLRSNTNENVLSNIILIIPSTSQVQGLVVSDLRSGRFGNQTVIDNVTLFFQNSKPILYLNNFINFDGGYQLIFKNSVNIHNNTFLVSQDYLAKPFDNTINKDFLVQESASVYHDFGKIHTYGQFPPINQFNTYNNIRRKEIRIDQASQIISQSVRNDYTYVIDGIITLTAGQYIDIPTNGATIIGYGFDVSKIIKNVAGEPIFRSVTGGMRNLIIKDVDISSGLGSVFNLTDIDGTSAIEFNDVNFNNCASLGVFNGFRQFTGTTCGIYGVSDGFTLEGTWNGFKMTNTNISGFGATGTLIKRGTSTLFRNRVYLDLNLIFPVGSKITDLQPSNFQKPKSLQIKNCYVTVNNVVDDSLTSSLIPNIGQNDSVSDWLGNVGIYNTITAIVNSVVSSASTLALSSSSISTYYTFTGTTATYTLPTVASSTNKRIIIINAGSGNITVNSNSGGNDIWDAGMEVATSTLMNTLTITLFCDGVKWRMID